MADYYRKDEQINGTHYRIYVEATDGTPRQASFQLVQVADDGERSLMDPHGRFTLTAKDLPTLRHNLNAAMRGLGVGADLEEIGVFPRHHQEWTREEDEELIFQFQEGNELATIARSLGRSVGAVYRRLRRLGFNPDEAPDPARRPQQGNGPADGSPSEPPRGAPPGAPPSAPPPSGPSGPSTPPPAPPDWTAPTPPTSTPYPPPPPPPTTGAAEEHRRGGGGPFRLGG